MVQVLLSSVIEKIDVYDIKRDLQHKEKTDFCLIDLFINQFSIKKNQYYVTLQIVVTYHLEAI